MPEINDPTEWQGRTMYGSDGDKIGKISEIFEDHATGRPEWATVSSGLFGTKSNFVPLDGAQVIDDDIRARVTKDQVKDAPGVDHDGELSGQEERRLFDHYGLPYETGGSSRGRDATGPRPPAAGRDQVDSRGLGGSRDDDGRSRLRRYVVTETVIAPAAAGDDAGTARETRIDEQGRGDADVRRAPRS